jgi:hypothetical protein
VSYYGRRNEGQEARKERKEREERRKEGRRGRKITYLVPLLVESFDYSRSSFQLHLLRRDHRYIHQMENRCCCQHNRTEPKEETGLGIQL